VINSLFIFFCLIPYLYHIICSLFCRYICRAKEEKEEKTLMTTLKKKMEFGRTFLRVLQSGKRQNPRKGSAWKWVLWKTNETIYDSLSKMVQSNTQGTIFKWFFIKHMPNHSSGFCNSQEVQSLKTIVLL
jgi:hypothetical protein